MLSSFWSCASLRSGGGREPGPSPLPVCVGVSSSSSPPQGTACPGHSVATAPPAHHPAAPRVG